VQKAPLPRKSAIITLLILLLLLSGFILLNYLILTRTHYSFRDDHLLRSLRCLEGLKTGSLSEFFLVDQLYPPLMNQTSALWFWFFPPSVLSAALSQLPFWTILAFSLYGIGSLLFSPLTGLLAVFYFFTSPLALGWSYQYMLDIPAAAMLCLSFWLLLKSRDFQERNFSLAFGLSLGLGLLTKWSAFYLLLPLLLYYLFRLYPAFLKDFWFRLLGLALPGGLLYLFVRLAKMLPPGSGLLSGAGETLLLWLTLRGIFRLARKGGKVDESRFLPLLNFTEALLLGFLLSAWLYFDPRFCLLSGWLLETAQMGDVPWPGLGCYPAYLLRDALRPGYLPFLLIGLAAFLPTSWKDSRRRLLLLAVGGAFFLLELTPNKQESRYLLPWLALASPLAVFWFDYLKKFKLVPVIALLSIGLLYAFSLWNPWVWSHKDNPILAFLLRGAPSLTGREVKLRLEPEKLQAFLQPIPNRGRGVGVINLVNEEALGGSGFIIIPSYLLDYRLDQVHSEDIGAYRYCLSVYFYAEKQDNIEKKIRQMKGWGEYDFSPLTRYPFPEGGFELVLSRIVKKNPGAPNPASPPRPVL